MIDRMIALERLQEERVISYDSNTNVPLLPIQKLFQRAFWERLWVVQEIALAKMLIVACGEDLADWRYINHAIAFFYLLRSSIMSNTWFGTHGSRAPVRFVVHYRNAIR
jgi:hypothetical protein